MQFLACMLAALCSAEDEQDAASAMAAEQEFALGLSSPTFFSLVSCCARLQCLQAALRSAEDEQDAAAAVVAEQEVAAELAEFTQEPAPGAEGGEGEDGDGDGEGVGGGDKDAEEGKSKVCGVDGIGLGVGRALTNRSVPGARGKIGMRTTTRTL